MRLPRNASFPLSFWQEFNPGTVPDTFPFFPPEDSVESELMILKLFIRGCLLGGMLVFVSGLVSGCEKKKESSSEQPAAVSSQPTERSQDEPARIRPVPPDPATWKKPQRILYVGLLKTDRARQFISMLKSNFPEVQTLPFDQFAEAKTNGFDVTIVDRGGTDWVQPKFNLSDSFAQPLITLGVPGAFICGHLGLKTGYL